MRFMSWVGTGHRIRLRGQKQGCTARETKKGLSKPVEGVHGEGSVGSAQQDGVEVRAGLVTSLSASL